MNKRIMRNGAMDFHVIPPYGLLNDPNGLVHYKGLTHVFFQWNPYGTDHSYKAWGHAVTTDHVTYTYYEPALSPDKDYDKNGCYSGSALVYEDKLYLFYTGNVKNEQGERESYQCVAVSEDGFHFKKLGPVIDEVPGYTSHVRDPKVFQGDQGIFYMVLGAQREDLTGDTIIFTSEDLMHWEFLGSLMSEKKTLGYMWECPDLVRLPEGDVFILSPQGLEPEGYRYHNIYQAGYFTGIFQNGIFTPESSEFEELDRGFEFYAPQTFQHPDGRTLLMGWMGTMEKEDEEALPTMDDGWVHHLSIIRELEIGDGNKLLQKPVRELHSYFRLEQKLFGNTMTVPRNKAFRLKLSCDSEMSNLQMYISSDVKIAADGRWFRVERKSWKTGKWETRKVPLSDGLKLIEIYGDTSSLELFINGGEEVSSLRCFNEDLEERVIVSSLEKVHLEVFSYSELLTT